MNRSRQRTACLGESRRSMPPDGSNVPKLSRHTFYSGGRSTTPRRLRGLATHIPRKSDLADVGRRTICTRNVTSSEWEDEGAEGDSSHIPACQEKRRCFFQAFGHLRRGILQVYFRHTPGLVFQQEPRSQNMMHSPHSSTFITLLSRYN